MKINKLQIIAIIPARGGSKSIPKKNLYILAGKPLIVHTIEIARKSKRISRVIVSTDDQRIAKISKKYGAEVIKRPAKISTCTATSESALLHALTYLKKKENYEPDIFVFLQCTVPLTTTEDIDGTIKTLINKNADSAFTVTKSHCCLWKKGNDGSAIAINHSKRKRLPRQKIKPQYRETGAVYVMRIDKFKRHKHRFFGKTVMHVMPSERSLDIDEPIDIKIAETLMKKR